MNAKPNQNKTHTLAFVFLSLGVWWLSSNYYSVNLFMIFGVLFIVSGASLLRKSSVKFTLVTGFVSGCFGLLYYIDYLLSYPSVLSILLFSVFLLICYVYAQNLFPKHFIKSDNLVPSWYKLPLLIDLSKGGALLPRSLSSRNKRLFLITNILLLILTSVSCLVLLLITLGVNIVSITFFERLIGAFTLIVALPILIFLIIALATAHNVIVMRVCVTVLYGYLALTNLYDALVNFELYSFAFVILCSLGFMAGTNFEQSKDRGRLISTNK